MAFPILHPGVKSQIEITGSAEKMKVIGHQQIESHQPRLRFAPRLPQAPMHQRLSQPSPSISGDNSYEDNGRLARMDMHPRGRMPPPDVSIVRPLKFHVSDRMTTDTGRPTDSWEGEAPAEP